MNINRVYSILILRVQNKPCSNIYFENLFIYDDIDWTASYMLPRLVMHNTYMRSFQYKIVNNILYLTSANLSNCKILQKIKKSLNLEPKMPYSGIFGVEV